MAGYATALEAVGSRLVLVGRPPLPGDLPVTVVQLRQQGGGAFQAADHLLTAGHRPVLFLGGAPGLSTADQRRDGFLHALRAHGGWRTPRSWSRRARTPAPRAFSAPGRHWRPASISPRSSRAPAWWRRGATAALREAGLDVPGDISLIGFADAPFAATSPPR
ncbi:substrate-binding domain-containing protein [Streptomyces sp. NPDC002324]